MVEHITTSVNFEHAVHSIYFQENGRKLSSYFFRVDQKIDKNIGTILKFHAIWDAARSINLLPRWNTLLLEQLSEWHQVMRLSQIGATGKSEEHTFAKDKNPPQTLGTESSHSLDFLIANFTSKNRNKYREYLLYIHKHHYVVSVGTAPAYDGGDMPMILMSLPLAENGTDVSHILSAVTPLN